MCLSVCVCEMGRTTLALSTSQVGTHRGAVRLLDVTAQHTHSGEEGRKDRLEGKQRHEHTGSDPQARGHEEAREARCGLA